MASIILENELKTCGKAFFVEYFGLLCQVDWFNDAQIQKAKKEISTDLLYKRRPDGGKYTESGLDIRFESFFLIFSQELQWDALENISQSKGVPADVRASAKALLLRELQDRADRKAEAERQSQERKRLAEEAAQQLQHKQAEYEAARKREEAKYQARIAEEKAKLEKLTEEYHVQEHIVVENQGWFFLGKKARLRRCAHKRLMELKAEIDSLKQQQLQK